MVRVIQRRERESLERVERYVEEREWIELLREWMEWRERYDRGKLNGSRIFFFLHKIAGNGFWPVQLFFAASLSGPCC